MLIRHRGPYFVGVVVESDVLHDCVIKICLSSEIKHILKRQAGAGYDIASRYSIRWGQGC